MKNMPPIHKYMTPMPHTIGQDIPLKTALDMMRDGGFRHLPVQNAGKLVGILTDRDIKLAFSFANTEKLTVEEVMTSDPYTVSPDMPLNRVVEQMAEHKYGCAVVKQENGKVVGIFTAIDALRAFGETLSSNYKFTAELN